MTFLDALSHLGIALLGAILSLSAHANTAFEHTRTLAERFSVPKAEHATLPALLAELDTIVSMQLRVDERYQQAAVLSASSTPVATSPIEDALVNIYCTARIDDMLRTTTGSGVLIDPKGVILTNAHVAQFLLLSDDTTRCTVRQGNPAAERYEAELLYLSPTWVIENAAQLHETNPEGTGERDFALLLITEGLAEDLPDTFPALALAAPTYAFDAAPVRAGGYPAPREDNAHTDTLVPVVASTSIAHLFTFHNGRVDLVSIASSEVGRHGSSGGPIVDKDGTVIGLIVTRGNPETDGEQSLRALTIPYIDRTLSAETGLSLTETLAGDLPLRAEVFRETLLPPLRTYLENGS